MKKDLSKFVSDGFSYLELLISLMTASLIMAAMPHILIMFQALELHEDNYDTDIFIMDITESYHSATDITSDKSGITFDTGTRKITYRFQSERIIKSIDGQGFVTLVFDVDNLLVSETGDYITLKIEGDIDETLTFKK